MWFGFLAFITASDWNAIASNFCFFFWAHVKRHLVAIVWNLSTLSLNVFLQVGIAEFLGKEKPRGSLLPFPRRLAQRRHTARRHRGGAAAVGECTPTTPRLGWNVSHPLCLVTMCYNVHNVLPLRLTRWHGRAKDSMFHHVCLFKMVTLMKSFPHCFG